MNKDEVIALYDKAIQMMEYYIPRIINSENQKWWYEEVWFKSVATLDALIIGAEGWEENSDQINACGNLANMYIKWMERDMKPKILWSADSE